MREFKIIDSAESVEKLRMRLKDTELEQYGEPLIPEYVYDVIRRLPRFAHMRRGHQQDAEEFLGFLLQGLHDECAQVLLALPTSPSERPIISSPTSESSVTGESVWLEVGPKQKAAVTRSSGEIVIDSPVTKIFGGKLRSELRIPGSKNSVTLEPYQPLQLDISSPDVHNITDALKGLTRRLFMANLSLLVEQVQLQRNRSLLKRFLPFSFFISNVSSMTTLEERRRSGRRLVIRSS